MKKKTMTIVLIVIITMTAINMLVIAKQKKVMNF